MCVLFSKNIVKQKNIEKKPNLYTFHYHVFSRSQKNLKIINLFFFKKGSYRLVALHIT